METDSPKQQGGAQYLPPNNWHKETFLATFNSLISILVEGLKLLTLANGGAVLALLTLSGTIITNCEHAPSLVVPIKYFSYGLIACFLGFVGSYITQMTFLKWMLTKNNELKQ